MYGGRTVLYFSKYTFIIKPFVILLRKKKNKNKNRKQKTKKKLVTVITSAVLCGAVKFRKQRK